MTTENPVLETVDKFYNNDSESNLKETSDDTTVDKVETLDPPQDVAKHEEPTDKVEESGIDDEVKESQFIELDGKEIDLEDIKKWRDGHLMQSDYTKKTTEHAQFAKKERDELALDRENLTQSKSEVSEMQDKLAVLVAEDEEIDWLELKETDPEEYIELKEKADKRRAMLEKVKAERETPVDDPALIAEEQGKLLNSNPEWLDKEGKTTDEYSKDMNLLSSYAIKAGFTQEEFSQMTRAHYLTTILKAAKYDELQEKGREIKERRDKVPVVTKPKATKQKAEPRSKEDLYYGS